MSILRWLGLADDADAAAGPAGLAEVEQALEHLAPERARFIACFAYILSRAARADHRVSADETREMERLVSERTGLAPGEARLVVGIATAHGLRHGGTEDFLVTREFSKAATRDQRLALLDCVFAVSSTDSSIRTVEDNEIRRIASELNLEHHDFIAVRRKYLDRLEVLRKPGPAEGDP
jgi:uncharacterized tellurite resistance protein B-like protein